jgi:hypothetical protein
MGVPWRSVGKIIQRVVTRLGPKNELDGLTQIGIDDAERTQASRVHHRRDGSPHREHRVGCTRHERRHAEELLRSTGRSAGGETRGCDDRHVCHINAVESMRRTRDSFDRFHVQRLAHDALDQVHRTEVRELKGTPEGNELKQARFPLQQNPWESDGARE